MNSLDSRDWLIKKYIEESLTMEQIASITGVKRERVKYFLKKHGVNKGRTEVRLSPKMLTLTCTECGSLCVKKRGYVRKRTTKGFTDFFCSRACTDKFHGKAVKGQGNPNFGGKFHGDLEEQRKRGVLLALRRIQSETSIERTIRESLEKTSITFKAQVPIGFFVVDFYLPEHNVIIEVNGGYWHGDKRLYAESDLNATQRKNVARDKRKQTFLERRGFTVLYLWEIDIKADPESCMDVIRRSIAS